MTKLVEGMSDNMKRKIEAALTKTASKKDFKTLDMLEKMISGALPINYNLIDRILDEETDVNERLASQNEMIRDLQSKLNDASTEEEKKSIRLKLDVANAKLAEIQAQASQPVEEEAPQQKKDFLDTDNNGNTIVQNPEQLDESYSNNEELKKLANHIDVLRKNINDIEKAAKSQKWLDIIDSIEDLEARTNAVRLHYANVYNASRRGELKEEVISEGCMSKKFEDMSNREVADYIFRHPHTKFGDKMKECDTAEIMKAIRSMKKANEDAPATNASAVATAPKPSMYMKRPTEEELSDNQ